MLSSNVGKFEISQKFALNDEWKARISQIGADKLTGSYEWVATVQKKFASTGRARFLYFIKYKIY